MTAIEAVIVGMGIGVMISQCILWQWFRQHQERVRDAIYALTRQNNVMQEEVQKTRALARLTQATVTTHITTKMSGGVHGSTYTEGKASEENMASGV